MKKIIYLFCCFLAFALLSSRLDADDLMQIYALALENDPTLKQAEAKHLSIKENKEQALARFFPNINATGNSSQVWRTNQNTQIVRNGLIPANQEYWAHSFNLNLVQPLFHWDYWLQLKQSDNLIAQTEASYNAELQNLMVRTAQAYFNILAAQDNLSFTQAEKKAIERQLEQAKARFDSGIIPITDVYEAQAAYDQTTANQIEAENNIDNNKEALREIIGRNENSLNRLGAELPLNKPEPNNMTQWSETAEVANYNIIAAFNQMQALQKTIEVQRSGHLPKLDIVGAYGISDDGSAFGVIGDNKTIGVQLNVPLFEGGAVNSKTRQAKYDYDAAKENLTAVKRSVKRQVNNTFRNVLSNISRIQALSSTVTSAANALEASEAGAEVGIRTMVDVLNEQRNLFRAKRDLAHARYDYVVNTLKLKQATSSLTQNDLELINRLLVGTTISPDEVESTTQQSTKTTQIPQKSLSK